MEHLDAYLRQMSQTMNAMCRRSMQEIADALWDTYERDGTIIICGNGGSAATASHFACDLAKWTARPGVRRVRALALTDNVPLMTAYSNDQSYTDVFVEQLIGLYRPGDLVFAISGSGNSPNVLRAISWANELHIPTVGITGFDGGQLARIVRHSLRVDNHSMPQVEDAHSVVCHALAVNMGLAIDRQRLEVNLELKAPNPVLIARSLGASA